MNEATTTLTEAALKALQEEARVLYAENVALKKAVRALEEERDKAVDALGSMALEKSRMEKHLWQIRRNVA